MRRRLPKLQQILLSNPTNVEALSMASNLALACGKAELADNYQLLYNSLTASKVPGGEASVSSSDVVSSIDGQENLTSDVSQDLTKQSGDSSQGEVADVQLQTTAGHLKLVGGTDAPEMAPSEQPNIKLSDVGGLEDVKKRINVSFLAPLRNPQLREQYGLSLKGGLLLYGPPGCGKTYIAKAIAGELQAKFISVALTDVLDMYVGESERKLFEIFEYARRSAPVVVFFDEIDALGHKRSNLRGTSIRGVVNTLLTELDGIDDKNDGLFVLAATNHPWDVDEALRRPGRIDRTVLVLPPDLTARRSILQSTLKDTPAKDIDFELIAKNTEDFSGADLNHLCKCAKEAAVESSLETGELREL